MSPTTILRLLVSLCFLFQIACGPPGSKDASEKERDQDTTALSTNPGALVLMTRFGGAERDGLHTCFWIGPATYESYNIAYPDEGAVYWTSSFQIPDDAAYLELAGKYPNARYFSFNAYDVLTQPIDALADIDIIAQSGANPFVSEDASGGLYTVKVISRARPKHPSERIQNALYLGDDNIRNDALPVIFRIYVPAKSTDLTGGADLPVPTLVKNDGSRIHGQAMCDMLKSPVPGTVERTVPSVVMPQETYSKLLRDEMAGEGFPAEQDVQWTRFWGGDVEVSRLIPGHSLLLKALEDAKDGKRKIQSGFYANAHNQYISAYISEKFGNVLVLSGKLPRTPESGWSVSREKFDLRYWSLCTNESLVTTRYAACVLDSDVVLNEDRTYTIVVSKQENRPVNAREECGVTWLDWGDNGDGAGNTDLAFLILRNMLGKDFQNSVQNINDPTPVGVQEAMADYYPATRYSSKAEFEAGGCELVK